jgi:4-hydroxy-3-methylbut-2-enyl diphosphate reductase
MAPPRDTRAVRRVLLAAPRGFCAGVDRAIAVVRRELELHGPPVYVRREIVHNRRVVAELASLGAVFVESEEDVPEGAICVFSAHGVAPAARARAHERRLAVVDATCPLVTKVHREAERYAAAGRLILLIGHQPHEEIDGTYGVAPERTYVIESEQDVIELELPRDQPIAVLTQTTLSVEDTRHLVDFIRARFDDVALPAASDICYATQNRQDAVRLVARQADFVVVVGSRNSSNSNRLVEVARSEGTPAMLIDDVDALDMALLGDVSTVGVSAGASVPEQLVIDLLARLGAHGFRTVETEEVATERTRFSMPPSAPVPLAATAPEDR